MTPTAPIGAPATNPDQAKRRGRGLRGLGRSLRPRARHDNRILERLSMLVCWQVHVLERGGKSVNEITRRFIQAHPPLKRSTLYRWRERFARHGVAGLADGRVHNGARPGRGGQGAPQCQPQKEKK